MQDLQPKSFIIKLKKIQHRLLQTFDDDISLFLELLTDPVITLLWFSASFCVDVTSTFPTVEREGKRRGGVSWNFHN